MRQQAKPFTVEVKKSRKSTTENPPLFGFLEEPAAAAPSRSAAEATDKLFGRRPETAESRELASVFGGTAVQERPATRILPDLTVRSAPTIEEDAPKPRKPRVAKTKGPRIPKAKHIPVEVREVPVRREVLNVAVQPIKVRRRAKDETGLARAERWKRRLPRFAR